MTQLELEKLIRDELKKKGGNSSLNLKGDKLWYTDHPINITELAKTIILLQTQQTS